MDIQAIIKQVISLAGLVIKNPSTSIKGSGIDFGSLIGMAGSMLGGKSGSSSSNAGGDILGSVLGGLMGGGSNNSGPDTPRTGSNDDGGGLGSILGGLAGMAGMGNAMGNIFSSNEASNLMSDVSQKEQTINDMLKDKNLNAEQKGNLTDMLGLLQVTERFLG